MITAAINLFIYAIILLVVGLYRPQWALFWMKKPDRFIVTVFAVVLFMLAATLFGEGERAKKQEAEANQKTMEIPSIQGTVTDNKSTWGIS